MSSEDRRGAASGVPSIIRPDLKIVGDLKSTADIQIDGTIEGLVKGALIIVSEQAKVEGSIIAETVQISGTVNGQVQAKTVHLDKGAKVVADISHDILTVEPGAYFEGQVQPLKQAISGRATTKSA